MDHMIKKANFTLQKVRNNEGYFAFEDQNSIEIICSDMRKVHSIIDGHRQFYNVHKEQEKMRRQLKMSGHIRVGSFLWVFGGTEAPLSNCRGIFATTFKRTLLWHIKKQMWIWGPRIPQKLSNLYDGGNSGVTGVSGIAINQTTGIIVFPNIKFVCIFTQILHFVFE